METVKIDKLNAEDRTFCISYPLEDGLLLSSVASFGVLSPLGLLGREHPIVVTGFKRLEAARKAGALEVPCVYLDISRRQALLTSIMDNMKRPLNIVEKASCIEKMQAMGFSTDEIYPVMKLLGLPARDETLKTAVKLAGAKTDVKDLIAAMNPPMGIVEQLFWFDAAEVGRIIDLAARLPMSMSNFRETVGLLMLLKIKQGRIEFAQLDKADNADELKQVVRHATHPALVGMEGQLDRLLAASALPPNIRVTVDPNFERDAIDISIRARTGEEMEGALNKLREIADRGIVRSILELTHGGPAHN